MVVSDVVDIVDAGIITGGCASHDLVMGKVCMSPVAVAVLAPGDVAMCVLIMICHNADIRYI